MKVLFLGGDLRQKYACEYLKNNNIDCEFYEDFKLDIEIKNKIRNASMIILPIPITKDDIHLNNNSLNPIELSDIFYLINKNHIIFGGKIPENIKNQLIVSKIQYLDFIDDEAFQIKNALLTAEGAIYYAKQKFYKSIHNSQIAVLGFGRIGKILAYLLYSQGAKITVCARKDTDFVWSKLIGFNGFKIKKTGYQNNLRFINKKYDIIFNTIPYWIMDEEFAKNINSDTIIIDLASRPFGIDEKIAKKYNLNYCRESGIPGRYAPISAGEIIGKTILNNILIKED